MNATDLRQQYENDRDEQISELFGDLNGLITLKRTFAESHISVGITDEIPTKDVLNALGITTDELIKRLDAIEAQQDKLTTLFFPQDLEGGSAEW